jgi:hypothetical protein
LSFPDAAIWIPDPKTATKEKSENKLLSYFFKNIFVSRRRKNFGPIYTELLKQMSLSSRK